MLIDSGSSVSMIEENIANEARLQGPRYSLQIQSTGDDTRSDKFF